MKYSMMDRYFGWMETEYRPDGHLFFTWADNNILYIECRRIEQGIMNIEGRNLKKIH